MAPLNLLVAGLNFTKADKVKDGIYQFIADRSLVVSSVESLSGAWSLDSRLAKAGQWLLKPGEKTTSLLESNHVNNMPKMSLQSWPHGGLPSLLS